MRPIPTCRLHGIGRIGILTFLSLSVLGAVASHLAFAESALAIATQAYIYGHPLVTMDMTRRVMTNVAVAGPARAAMDEFIKLRTYPAVDDHSVTAPNADTLYTIVWLDVSKEPWILSIPDRPLSSYGKPYTPPPGRVDASLDMKKAVRDQVDSMDTVTYFGYLAKLMKDNPPAAADAPMLAKMAKIGLVPGRDFDPGKLGLLD